MDRANYQGLELDATVELIRGLIPLGLVQWKQPGLGAAWAVTACRSGCRRCEAKRARSGCVPMRRCRARAKWMRCC
ncbi:MAG: hypothetical protein ACREXR_11990 [Gammaproteobacteria bacterium]